MRRIQARKYIGMGFPPDEGRHLAAYLLSNKELESDSLTIDVSDLTASLLISAFFNGFLQEVFDQKPEALDKARAITWQLAYPFQRENVQRWMSDFRPYIKNCSNAAS